MCLLNIFGCLEASAAMLTSVWVSVGFLMSTDDVRGLLVRVAGLNVVCCERRRDALVLVTVGKCPRTSRDRA